MKLFNVLFAHRMIASAVFLALAVQFLSPARAAQEVTLSHKKLSLNANLVMADGKKVSDNVILISHGTLAHNGMEVIKSMQNLLAERGWNSLAINLSLGLSNRHGMYDCKTPHKHLHTDALDEIGIWLKWLKNKGATGIVLMGHSRGGNQIAWFAAERGDPSIKKVVLLAPQVWSTEEAEKDYQKRFGTPVGSVLAKAEKLVAAGKGSEMMKKIGFIYCPDTSASAAAFISYNKPDPRQHTPNLLARISVPMLVVAASDDKVVKGLIKAVKPLADGDKVHLKVVEEADHYFRDFVAEDAADAIDEFLQK